VGRRGRGKGKERGERGGCAPQNENPAYATGCIPVKNKDDVMRREYLGETDARRLLVVDVTDVDGSGGIDGRAGDERVELRHENDLTDAAHVHRAQLVRSDPTRRSACQLAKSHRPTLATRRPLNEQHAVQQPTLSCQQLSLAWDLTH